MCVRAGGAEEWGWGEAGRRGKIDESLLKVLAVKNDALKIIRPYNALEKKKKKLLQKPE